MSKKTADKGLFSDFFHEEAEEFLGPERENHQSAFENPSWNPTAKDEPPTWPEVEPATDRDLKAYWRALRVFFRSGAGEGIHSDAATTPVFPALLEPFRGRKHLKSDFPLWLADEETFQKEDEPAGSTPFLPLHLLLLRALNDFAPGEEEAKILKDNLMRLEVIVREKLQLVNAAFKAFPVIREGLETLKESLAVAGEEGKAFETDIAELKNRLPKSGMLLPLCHDAPLILLAALIRATVTQRQKILKEEINRLKSGLRDLLSVEREKTPEARSPETLQHSLDFAGDFLNFEELSSVLPAGTGGERMPAERQQRIEAVLATLDEADALLFRHHAVLVVENSVARQYAVDWRQVFAKTTLKEGRPGMLCQETIHVFDRQMDDAARVFTALRTAKLELDHKYADEIHGDFFAHFDWRSLTDEERKYCPPVMMIAAAATIRKDELNSYSKLLASNRPVKVLLLEDFTAGEKEQLSNEVVFRQELAAIAAAHRNGYICQASYIQATALAEGFRHGLQAPVPVLFHLFSPQTAKLQTTESFLWTSAATEGRAFPGFVYDSEKGPRWGSRFDISNNPQPEAEWPRHVLPYKKGTEAPAEISLPFTFADFAALEEAFSGHFQLVPPEYWTDDLVTVDQYLTLPPEEAYAKVPYIWLVDSGKRLQLAAVAWPVIQICRERLDFWRYLQENAGVHSYHAELASAKVTRELKAQAEQEIAVLKAAHAKEIEKAREESARQAMGQLAASLLDMDAAAVIPDAVASRPATVQAPQTIGEPKQPPAADEPAAPEKEAAPMEEDMLLAGEAWIETALCTSCNECINLNNRIFKYNTEKQAYIADPAAGPFSDIVKAAEKCPAGIIHPGTPLNPDEPGVEEWVKKAEAFN